MKYSKYYGSEYAPDPFFCIEVLEKQIATLTADKRILKAAIEYYKDDVVVMKARISRLETEMKEKDAIISTRTEVVHQLQDALSVRDRQIATLTAATQLVSHRLSQNNL